MRTLRMLGVSLAGLVVAASAAVAGTAVCPCTADNSVASTGNEARQNSGRRNTLKIKHRENQLLLKFDLSVIPRDATIQSAVLRVRMTKPEFTLRQVGLSSVTTDWVEGGGEALDGEGEAGGPNASCFDVPGPKGATWAGEDSSICDVVFGNGGSIGAYTFARPEADDWWAIDVDPRIVAAMRADSHGLYVMDESGWWAPTRANMFIHSRESKTPPTLTVQYGPPDAVAPAVVRDLKVSTDNLDDGQALLTFAAGDDGQAGPALGYEIRHLKGAKITADNWLEAKVAPRYETPRPVAGGAKQRAWLTGVTPGETYSFAVVAYDRSANRSAIVASEPVKLPKRPAPRLAALKPIELGTGGPVVVNNKMALWVTDELTKVCPVTGKVLDGNGYVESAARKGSHVWDGKDRAIRLQALRGEVVGFNLVIEALDGGLDEIRVVPGELLGPAGQSIQPKHVVPHRVWYAKGKEAYFGDATPVLDKPLQIPAADNKVDGQTNQSVYVDLHVPRDAPAGAYAGRLAVASSAGQGDVAVQLTVLDLAMPAELSYIIELNSYGCGQDRQLFWKMHRLAHLHRTGYNVLSYGHCQSVTVPFMPKLDGEGKDAKIADWSEYDAWMGPLLDGSAFADLPRGAVPIPHWYLPFHENYPMSIVKHYAIPEFFENKPLGENGVFDYEAWKDVLAEKDVDIREAFDKVWHEGNEAVARQYRRHFIDKGWTRTQFQIFCNNKHYFREAKTQNPNETGSWQKATSLWTLDEPSFGRDFRALGYIYSVFKKPMAGPPLNVLCRGDVSRPQWQGDRLDGVNDVSVVSSALYQYQSIIQRRRVLYGDGYWFYGGGPGPDSDNTALAAVYIKAWTLGADGGLAYWTSFAGQEGWDRPTQLSVVHLNGGKGYAGPVATARLKAQRRAQQDVELMNMLAKRPGWDRNRVARAIAAAVNLASKTEAKGADDPGQTSFADIHAHQLAQIRAALVAEILSGRGEQQDSRAGSARLPGVLDR